jgi:cold shock protein
MPTGTVKWFNTTKGYGFIAPDDGGKDIFVHISAVERAGLTGLADNQKVAFEMIEGRDGRQVGGSSSRSDVPAAPRFPAGAGRLPGFATKMLRRSIAWRCRLAVTSGCDTVVLGGSEFDGRGGPQGLPSRGCPRRGQAGSASAALPSSPRWRRCRTGRPA